MLTSFSSKTTSTIIVRRLFTLWNELLARFSDYHKCQIIQYKNTFKQHRDKSIFKSISESSSISFCFYYFCSVSVHFLLFFLAWTIAKSLRRLLRCLRAASSSISGISSIDSNRDFFDGDWFSSRTWFILKVESHRDWAHEQLWISKNVVVIVLPDK